MTLPPLAKVRSLLAYNGSDGSFVWRATGKPAGGMHNRGYITIGIDGQKYLAHRLAWLLAFGREPEHTIDHIDGDRTNNRLANLRDVTHRVNSRNLSAFRNNTSGVVGVHWDSKTKRWKAQISTGPRRGLGSFVTFEEAVAARLRAEALQGYHINHGRISA